MEGIAHSMSPLSAPWCGWTMLVLFLCAILSEFFQPGVITQAMASLRVRTDRMYKDAPVNFFGQFFITLFRLGTLAMALCLCFSPTDRFSFAAFAAVCGIIIGVLLVKMVCNVIVDYTFMLSRRFGAMYEHYSNIATLIGIVLWPIVLVLLHVSNMTVVRWVLGVVAFLFVVLWIYRSAAQYIRSLKAILYLALYICTLELLPISMLLYLSAKTISKL